MKPRFFIHTTGCRANQWDSSVIAGNLEGAGYAPAGADTAELVVINACTVTEGAVRDIRRFINRVRRENPGAKVVLAGCHPQAYPDDSFGADLVLGQAEKLSPGRYASAAGNFVGPRQSLAMDEAPEDPAMKGKTRLFFKIQDGCDRFCSYCVVPYARGAPRSRPLAEMLRTMETLARRGTQEVVLTGIEISAWRDPESGAGLTELIAILEDAPTPPRIRLSSVDPLMFDTHFIETVAASRKLARSFHIPLQSASDSVLAAMRRPYRQEDVRKILDRVFARMPGAGIGMDVITGFPGESEALFEETRAFLESCPVYYLHVFPYSPRPGTAAARMDGAVPRQTAKARVAVLREIDARKREAFHRRFTGSRARIIPEGTRRLGRYMRGYTDNYIPVHIPYDRKLENRMVEVKINKVEGGIVLGEPIMQ
jgi:threonylcarbamoyladenosine tRNA methylthiotransferase MtaB